MAILHGLGDPLAINPLKQGQSVGASLLFLGLDRCMPLQHGARGCTSFNKLFFMRHFRDPIPLQTTAMELTTVVMGADANLVEALLTVCRQHQPAVIGLTTTGLTATQGASLNHSLHQFRANYPEYQAVLIVPVETCDSQGGLETGYAMAMEALLRLSLGDAEPQSLRYPDQITVLISPLLTPEDVNALRRWIESYRLTPVMLPDLGQSLDGHLTGDGYSPLTQGGTSPQQLNQLGHSVATLIVGTSLHGVGDWLAQHTGSPVHRFAGLHDLASCDRLNSLLSTLSGRPVPQEQNRRRQQLLDAMLDCQFRLGVARCAVACESDLLLALSPALHDVGAELSCAVVPNAPTSLGLVATREQIEQLPCGEVYIGDLNLLARLAQERQAELLICNSHGIEIAQQLGIGLLPAGYPLNRHAGGQAKQWIGYAGCRQLLYDMDNLLAHHQRLLPPYRSRFWSVDPVSSQGVTLC